MKRGDFPIEILVSSGFPIIKNGWLENFQNDWRFFSEENVCFYYGSFSSKPCLITGGQAEETTRRLASHFAHKKCEDLSIGAVSQVWTCGCSDFMLL